MEIISVKQGTPEWHAHRATHFNASDAPAMMGESKYKTRDQLLAEVKRGYAEEVDAGTQILFDKGHRYEALARPLAEKIIGEDLYPVTGSDGRLSASFDGLPMSGNPAFEHKALNDELRQIVNGSSASSLSLHYRIQMEQQCMVAKCDRVLFMATSWDKEDNLLEFRYCWYESDPALAERIRRGWEQFEADLQAFNPAPVAPKLQGRAPDELPALRIEISGEVRSSNLDAFRETAVAVFKGINKELSTDEDFANAEKTIKWCEGVEAKLLATKEHALSQTESIDALFRTIDAISEEARKTRLDLDKLVKSRKDAIKSGIVDKARADLAEYMAGLSKRTKGMMPAVGVDWQGAIKNKRTVESLQSSVNEVLLKAKLDAVAVADRIEVNLKSLTGEAHDWTFLFPDLSAVCAKSAEDFANLLTARIATHKEAEDKRRADEQARQAQQAEAAKPQPEAANEPVATSVSAPVYRVAQPSTSGPANLKLGDISLRLGFTVTADFLTKLGYPPAATDKAAKLYREADFLNICRALYAHIQGVAKAHTQREAA